MMQQSTEPDAHSMPKTPPPDADWGIPPTSGLKGRGRGRERGQGGWLAIGALGRRRSKIMPLRSKSGRTAPPRPTHTPPLLGQLPPPAAELPPPLPPLPPPAELPPPVAELLTAALIPRASTDLQQVQERTQLSRTDIVNRALTLYNFVDAEQRAGSELILRRSNGEEHIVKFL